MLVSTINFGRKEDGHLRRRRRRRGDTRQENSRLGICVQKYFRSNYPRCVACANQRTPIFAGVGLTFATGRPSARSCCQTTRSWTSGRRSPNPRAARRLRGSVRHITAVDGDRREHDERRRAALGVPEEEARELKPSERSCGGTVHPPLPRAAGGRRGGPLHLLRRCRARATNGPRRRRHRGCPSIWRAPLLWAAGRRRSGPLHLLRRLRGCPRTWWWG